MPASSNLAIYDFEQNALDSSGAGRNATALGSPVYGTGTAYHGTYGASASSGGSFSCPTSVLAAAGVMEGIFTAPSSLTNSKMLWSCSSTAGSRALEIYYFGGSMYAFGNGVGGTNTPFFAPIAGQKYYVKDTWDGAGQRRIWIGQVTGAGIVGLTKLFSSTGSLVASPTGVYLLNNSIGSGSDWAVDWVRFRNVYDDSAVILDGATPPTGLAVGTPTEEAIPVTFTVAVAPAERTLLYYSTTNNSATATLAGAVTAPGASGTIGGLASSTTYYIWAKTETISGLLSDFTASVSATTAAAVVPIIPATPTSLASGAPTAESVGLTWVDGANTSFIHVYRNTVNNSATAVLDDIAAAGAQAVTVCGLSQGTTYYFWLKAQSSDGNFSAFTSSVTATTGQDAQTPSVLTVTATGRTTSRLLWTDGPSNLSIDIYRGLTSTIGDASFVANLAAGTQEYLDSGLADGTSYYYWIYGRTVAGVSNALGPETITTYGSAGNPGTNIVSQIVTAAKTRLAAVLSSDFEQLKHVKDLKKNERVPWGYGVTLGEETPSEASVFGSYTADLALQVILYRSPNAIQNDRDIETAELTLEQWKDRVHREFTTTRLYENDVIVRIGDPDVSPEYLEDSEAVALRLTFPVMYRNSRA